MPAETTRTQLIALFLIVLACIAMGVGEHRQWSHLIDFANMFGGGGVGILTGQHLSSLNQRGPDSTINVNTPPV
jgi:hypothetical protein